MSELVEQDYRAVTRPVEGTRKMEDKPTFLRVPWWEFFDDGNPHYRSTPTDMAFGSRDQEPTIFQSIRDQAVQHNLGNDRAVSLRRFVVHGILPPHDADGRVSWTELLPRLDG